MSDIVPLAYDADKLIDAILLTSIALLSIGLIEGWFGSE